MEILLPFVLLLLQVALHKPCQAQTCHSMSSFTTPRTPRTLPDRLLIGYASWAQCDEKIIAAVQNGLNVVVWFSINLAKDEQGNPVINGAVPDLECVARVTSSIREQGLDVTHIIAIGGWNSPLPDASFSASQWFRVFDQWNRHVVAKPSQGWMGFDGIDWDPEGNDDVSKQSNHFTVSRMQLIGEISILAKQAGYTVSMAPAQSYLDVFTNEFSLSANHPPLQWSPDFTYHGRNVYAYWLSKYGQAKLPSGDIVPTFDWIALQLYEGWSHANFRIVMEGLSVKDYMRNLVKKMKIGWTVDFASEPDLNYPSALVNVPPARLVIGLANGWTKPYPPQQKFLLLQPEHVEEAYLTLPDEMKPRGFMFWNIADEGQKVNGDELYMARGLNKFLCIRSEPS